MKCSNTGNKCTSASAVGSRNTSGEKRLIRPIGTVDVYLSSKVANCVSISKLNSINLLIYYVIRKIVCVVLKEEAEEWSTGVLTYVKEYVRRF